MERPSGVMGETNLVLETDLSKAPEAPDVQATRPDPRPFGRLRPRLEAAIDQASAMDLNEVTLLPVDSSKTFVGPNGTYYDERWRWMEWRGQNRSWNWAAALSFGGWLAYRRLYRYAALHFAWLSLLIVAVFNGLPLRVAVLAQLAVAIGVGLYGNFWYQREFRQAASDVARDNHRHDARLDALAQAGGVDRQSVWVIMAALVGMLLLTIAFDGPGFVF